MQKQRLNLDAIQVNSFVTSIDSTNNTVQGGTGDTITFPTGCPNVATCGPCPPSLDTCFPLCATTDCPSVYHTDCTCVRFFPTEAQTPVPCYV